MVSLEFGLFVTIGGIIISVQRLLLAIQTFARCVYYPVTVTGFYVPIQKLWQPKRDIMTIKFMSKKQVEH